MSRELRAFKDALLVRNVVARVVEAEEHEAMEFPTEEALDTYLKEHPRAKPENHTVKRPKHDDNAKPLDKKTVERFTQHALSGIEQMEDMLEGHKTKRDSNYVQPLSEQMPHHMSNLVHYVNKMQEGINHIPKGKERERAKAISQEIDKAIEAPNKEMGGGARWNRPGRAPYLSPNNVEKMLKTLKPLVHELDQLYQGQRTLMAGEQHDAMEFPSEDALNKYLEKHPKADKSKHTVKKPKEQVEAEGHRTQIGHVWDKVKSKVEDAKKRREETTKVHEDLKKLQEHFYDDKPATRKKYDALYKKLYEQGEKSAQDAKALLESLKPVENHFVEGSQQEAAARLLDDAVRDWQSNTMDHLRTNRDNLGHLMGLQAERTWAYATKIDDQIEMLDKAIKGEYDE